jgi:hypothetical protein
VGVDHAKAAVSISGLAATCRRGCERAGDGACVVPVVRHKSNQIVRDEEYRDIGRAPWRCDYFVSPDDPSARALIPTLKAAMAPYQALYDLGVVCG